MLNPHRAPILGEFLHISALKRTVEALSPTVDFLDLGTADALAT